jgi:hypothetical protein
MLVEQSRGLGLRTARPRGACVARSHAATTVSALQCTQTRAKAPDGRDTWGLRCGAIRRRCTARSQAGYQPDVHLTVGLRDAQAS